MKKLLFAAYSLDVGGIEKALITLVNKLQELGYDITIVLEKKQGIFLDELNKNIKIIEYTPCQNKNVLIRKFKNMLKQLEFTLKYKNKYDFAASYATYSRPASFVARTASKNATLWVHTDYLAYYKKDVNQVKEFYSRIKYKKFKNVVFVSENAKDNFYKIFPDINQKLFVFNNLIDYKKIQKLANEKIDIKKENIVTFLNIGRHDEESKRLTRLIDASKMLVNNNLKFKVLLVGDGKDTQMYKRLVKEKQLEEYIIFVGQKKNPYPYFKVADCIVLSSEYEGYPVVFLESFVFNKPIITTKVSDYKKIENNYGLTAEKTSQGIYEKMKLFIENGYEIKEKFNPEEFNNQTLSKLEKIF